MGRGGQGLPLPELSTALPASSTYPVSAVEGVQVLQGFPHQLSRELAVELGQLAAGFQVQLRPRLLLFVFLFPALTFAFFFCLLSSDSLFSLHQGLWSESTEVGSFRRPKGEFHLLILL